MSDGKTAVATIGGVQVQFQCWLDVPEDLETFKGQSLPGQVRGRYQITYVAADAALVNGTALTIEGVNYTVRWTRQQDDGAFSVAELAKA